MTEEIYIDAAGRRRIGREPLRRASNRPPAHRCESGGACTCDTPTGRGQVVAFPRPAGTTLERFMRVGGGR